MTQEDKAKAYDELIKDIKRKLEVQLKEKEKAVSFLDRMILCSIINTLEELLTFSHEATNTSDSFERQSELPNSAYTSNKSITEFANNYSHMIWEKLMDKFNKIENYSIGCNDVSDIVLNAIINTYNWLKKQDEEKPIDKIKLKPEGKSALEAINEEKVDNANKVKPKFKIGDWIINKANHSVYQVIGYENNIYRIKKPDCVYYELLSDIDETYRLWHITDAKDGDIIVTGNGNIFIFKGIQDCVVYDYCGLYYGKTDIYPSNVNESCAKELPINYTPAVKEQRDLLMEALNKAGYTFDFDKKEVKSIKPKFHKGDYIASERGSFSVIVNVGDVRYEVENLNHKKVFPDIDYIDKRYHLYTIKDSKVGDVLSTKDDIFIFSHDNKAIVGIPKSCWNTIGYSELKFGFAFDIKDVHPATSEECDKLKEVMINYLNKYGK